MTVERKVVKYKLLPWAGLESIELPIGALAISVSCQGGELCLWALGDINAELEFRTFLITDTSSTVTQESVLFIDTASIDDLVFHVFEVL